MGCGLSGDFYVALFDELALQVGLGRVTVSNDEVLRLGFNQRSHCDGKTTSMSARDPNLAHFDYWDRIIIFSLAKGRSNTHERVA